MTLTQLSLQRHSVVWFILVLFVVGGVWSFTQMGKKEDSTFVLKSAVVTCSYAGATPFEVEQLISEPISRELQSMRRVKKITSESYYGRARIVVELEAGVRADEIPQLWDELRRKAMNISSSLPSGAGPILVKDDFSDVYGLYYALVADEGFSWDEIRAWAERLKTELVTIEGVQKVALQGEQQPVVNIFITKSTLANFSITPEMIAATLSQQNDIVDTGEIEAGQMRVRVLEAGVYTSIEDISNQLLIAPDGRQFRLGDVARIEQGYLSPPSVVMKVDGRRAVGLGVSSDSDADVVRLGKDVNALLERMQSQMPIGLEVVSLYPEDKIAREANLSFMLNVFASVAIVILVLMLSMGVRAGVLIGSSLIFTIGGTMLCMYGLGEGINRTSLAGFIIAMGMLVDNAIVVVDNGVKGMRGGLPLGDALVQGAERPMWGLLGATFIAIFSFLPLYLAPSSVAEIIKPLFVVVALSLLLSWELALTQVSMFGQSMLRVQDAATSHLPSGWFAGWMQTLLARRWMVVVCVVVLFAGAIFAMSRMPQNFFPRLDKPYFRADVILPEGYDIQSTEQHIDSMTAWLNAQPEVVRVSATVGATPLRYYLASGSVADRPNFGNLLVEVESRRMTKRVKARFDEYVAATYPDVWLRSSLFALSPVPDATIEIGFVGDDVDTLLHLTSQVERIMNSMAEATNVRNSWGNRIATWLPVYSQIKGQRIGVSRSRMAEWITLATEGFHLGEYRRGDETMPILLKDEDIEDYPSYWTTFQLYDQASARFDFDFRTGVVKQYNRERVMKAQCDPREGVNTRALLERILTEVERQVVVPDGYTLKIFGEQESQEESNRALGQFLPLTLVLIFITLLLLFNNFRDPIIILLMTPLIFIGVVLGLLLTGNEFDFFSLLGLLGLVGMNIKNGVILLDSIRERRASGREPMSAIVEAASDRLQPVVLASLTTILALVPLLFDSLFASMAATIMGGLLVATLLTMIVLPVVYAIFYGVKPTK